MYYTLKDKPSFKSILFGIKLGIGIAKSEDLETWTRVGEIKETQSYEKKRGLGAPGALIKDGKIHLFYQAYGNPRNGAIYHAYSEDGINFTRNPTNPIIEPKGEWNNGRAIDADIIEYKEKYFLYWATRDPKGKIQMLGVSSTEKDSDFSKNSWTQECTESILKPELPWEKTCIEAPAMCIHNEKLFMFYAGGYNNSPQQIGVAVSTDGINIKRIKKNPILSHGDKGTWNESESGHPYVFQDDDGRDYLFFQGNNDNGKTYYLSKVEIVWDNDIPAIGFNENQE
jgi:predicted GH43/DUF377 family glycosyl hydrolase